MGACRFRSTGSSRPCKCSARVRYPAASASRGTTTDNGDLHWASRRADFSLKPESMNAQPPRVAYFPDSFHEINGVAHTSRHFEAFARRHDLPFLCVRAGHRKHALEEAGNLWTLELPRGSFSIPLEK